jgi:integrase
VKNMGGVGSIYKVKGSNLWHGKFYDHGKPVRFACKTDSEPKARRVLRDKLKLAGKGKLPTAATRRTTLNDLANLVFADYSDNQYDSIERQRDAFNHLFGFFGANCPAEEITSARILEYKVWRPQQTDGRALKRKHDHLYKDKPARIGCSKATVNRELAALRHAFKLAAQQTPPLVTDAPHISLSRERNRRTGFFEWEQFEAVRDHLPDYLKAPMTAAYYTGWRCASELLTREKKHIVGDMLVLEAEEAKNEQPRRFPLESIPELQETIERQLEATRKLEVETRCVINLLFHHDGRPIVDYLPAWRKACAAAGLSGRLVHDFRRTAARNLVNAGVDPLTTMQLVGWEDIGMLKRYNIINDETLKRGAAKLSLHLKAEQEQRAKKVVAIRG